MTEQTRRPRIIVDERERNSQIPSILRDSGAAVEFAQLAVGDYILSPEIAVERKTVNDLINSVYDGRLFIQCSELAQHFKQPLVLVEGYIEDLEYIAEDQHAKLDDKKKRVLAERLPLAYDSLAEVALDYRMSIIHASSPDHAALLILALANKGLRGGLPSGPLLRKIRKDNPLLVQQLSILASVPGIGDKLAGRMLRKFKTPRRALHASAAEMATIPGFGLARAERVRKILDSSADDASAPAMQSKLFSE